MSGARGPVRTAVVGTGWWSTHAHLPVLSRDRRSRLVAVYDRDPERARIAAEAFRVPRVVEDVSELVGQVDAVIVATPQSAHAEPAGILLDAGIDVLVEKPLTIEPHDAWDLVRRAERAGARLHVGHTFPYHPGVLEARRAVRSGELGGLALATGLFSTAVAGLYRGETDFAREHTGALLSAIPSTYADPVSGGHLYSQLSHPIALLLFVLDERVTTVSAMAKSLGSGTDIADSLVMSTESGLVISLAGAGTVDHHDRRSEEYRLFGDGGRLLLDTAAGSFELSLRGGELRRTTAGDVDLSPMPAERLLAAATGEAEVLVDGVLGAHTVEVLAAARRSAKSGGQPIVIDPR